MNKTANKRPTEKQLEKLLLPRLKAVGVLLILFALIALIYAFILPSTPDDGIETLSERESPAGLSFSDLDGQPGITIIEEERQLFYLFTVVFSAVGSCCYYTAVKRTKRSS